MDSTEDKKQEMKPNVEEQKKAPRKATAYNEFVRSNYKKVNELPVKQRFEALGKLWKEQKMKQEQKKSKK
jgi:hypothetical protein